MKLPRRIIWKRLQNTDPTSYLRWEHCQCKCIDKFTTITCHCQQCCSHKQNDTGWCVFTWSSLVRLHSVPLSLQAPIEVMDTAPSPPPPIPSPALTAMHVASTAPRPTRSQQYNPEENTITNICTSNIILDLPQVTTRSRTGAIKPQPPPIPVPQNPPTVTKIIIKQTQLPSGAVTVTATAASSPRQPPPLQQMQSTPPPPRLQQMVHAQAPPPLQAKPRGGGIAAATAPPPLQIKVVPPSRQSDSSKQIIVTSAGEMPLSLSSDVTMEVGQSAAVVTRGEVMVEAEEGVSSARRTLTTYTIGMVTVKPARLSDVSKLVWRGGLYKYFNVFLAVSVRCRWRWMSPPGRGWPPLPASPFVCVQAAPTRR